MKNERNLFLLLLRKYKVIICIMLIFIFVIIVVSYESGKFNFSLVSDWVLPFTGSIIFIIIFFVLYEKDLLKKKIIFEDKELIVFIKIFKKEIILNQYTYDNIYKFVIGRYYNKIDPERNLYSIYIDSNEQLIKILTLRTYKECLEIIDKIKKIGKMFYDDTDTYYMIEEDLFRNYYKYKKTVEEIKNSK